MIKRIFNKVLGKKPNKEEDDLGLFKKYSDKSGKVLEFLQKIKTKIISEFLIINKKLRDLQNTNFQLGLKHLENGHLREASFRFFIMRKFWKEDFDAYYQHAYCLVLRGKNLKARQVLLELLSKNPSYDSKATDLLNHINQSLS